MSDFGLTVKVMFSVSQVGLIVEWPLRLRCTAGSDETRHVFLEVFLKFPENLRFHNEKDSFLPKWWHLGVCRT